MADWIWTESFWLPHNLTWEDVEPTPENGLANIHHLWYSVLGAFVCTLLKYVIEILIFQPLGLALGLPSPRRRLQVAPKYRSVFAKWPLRKRSKLTQKEWNHMTTKFPNLTQKDTLRLYRIWRQSQRVPLLKKFRESGGRLVIYSFFSIFGLFALWHKPWFQDTRYCWFQYPYHPIPSEIWYLYIMEISYYLSAVVTQFTDNKRKDFWEIFIHHIITIGLLVLSWISNFTRVGALVLILHDGADIILEMAKLFLYCKKTQYSRFFILGFSSFWLFTRLGLFPSWLLYSTTVEAGQFIAEFPVALLIMNLLHILMPLHFAWFYFIAKAILRSFWSRSEGDPRSDDSSSEDD